MIYYCWTHYQFYNTGDIFVLDRAQSLYLGFISNKVKVHYPDVIRDERGKCKSCLIWCHPSKIFRQDFFSHHFVFHNGGWPARHGDQVISPWTNSSHSGAQSTITTQKGTLIIPSLVKMQQVSQISDDFKRKADEGSQK